MFALFARKSMIFFLKVAWFLEDFVEINSRVYTITRPVRADTLAILVGLFNNQHIELLNWYL